MTLCSSHLLLSFLIYLPLFLFILKLIMPYCYLYCYHYSQFMLNKYHFCKKSVHSFLGLSNTTLYSPHHHSHHHHHHVSKCGLGLIIANEFNPNVIESSSLQVQHPNTKPMLPTSPQQKKDPGGIGFVDDMGGGVDGLMPCTESLGFESCNERRVDNNDCKYVELCKEEIRDNRRIKKNIEEKRSEDRRDNKFPPPLSSLNQNGKPVFYLKPVRQNGRLELTEVEIHRPEVLRAVRENGRLRMNLVSTDICSKTNDEEQEQEENEEIKQEEQVHNMQEEAEVEEEEEEMKVEGLWNYRVNGEGSRRCHEMVNYHQHHGINDHYYSLHGWRQPCVSIR